MFDLNQWKWDIFFYESISRQFKHKTVFMVIKELMVIHYWDILMYHHQFFETDPGESAYITDIERLNDQQLCSRQLHRLALICQFMQTEKHHLMKWTMQHVDSAAGTTSVQYHFTAYKCNVPNKTLMYHLARRTNDLTCVKSIGYIGLCRNVYFDYRILRR